MSVHGFVVVAILAIASLTSAHTDAAQPWVGGEPALNLGWDLGKRTVYRGLGGWQERAQSRTRTSAVANSLPCNEKATAPSTPIRPSSA